MWQKWLPQLWQLVEAAIPPPSQPAIQLSCDLRFLPGQSLTSLKNHTQSASGLWEEGDTIGEGDENIDRHKVMLNRGCGKERQAIHTQYGSQKTPACGFSPFLTMRVQALGHLVACSLNKPYNACNRTWLLIVLRLNGFLWKKLLRFVHKADC